MSAPLVKWVDNYAANCKYLNFFWLDLWNSYFLVRFEMIDLDINHCYKILIADGLHCNLFACNQSFWRAINFYFLKSNCCRLVLIIKWGCGFCSFCCCFDELLEAKVCILETEFPAWRQLSLVNQYFDTLNFFDTHVQRVTYLSVNVQCFV